jgi:NhaP-type Na+/H+ or K+/H+ antiporter
MVYFLPVVYQCTKRSFPLNSKELKVCWYSGLVRGVIAFALALQIETDNENFIITVVLVIVMITTLVGASLLKTFCEWIGLKS